MNRLKRLTLGLTILIASALAPASALAAQATSTGNIAGGALSINTTATPSFSATLDGTDQTAGYTVPTTVKDARGNGAGWNLTITSTQFTTGGATPSTLATTASSLTGVTNACQAGSTCINPTNSITYPVAVPAAATAPAAVKYFNAAALTGLGTFTNTPAISVALPADTKAGTYTSTLTVSVVTGP